MQRTVPTTGLTLVLCLVWIAAVQSQTPCTRSDNLGGTVLTVEMFESDTNPNPTSIDYRDLIPINGDVGQSNYLVTLTQQSAVIIPIFYFSVVNSENSQVATGTSSGTYLRLINPLNRDVGVDGLFTFGLICSWNGATTEYTLQVQLKDENANEFAPVLIIQDSVVSVVEAMSHGSMIATLSATDGDNPANEQGAGITFTLVSVFPVSENFLFTLGLNDGILWLTGSLLDQPDQLQYQLTIEARDSGTPQRTDTKTMTLNVVRNTGPPTFTNSGNYAASIDETLAVAESVVTVSATDGDPSQPPVTYSMVYSSDVEAMFLDVNPNSGLVYVLKSLTDDVSLAYTVLIKATNSGGLSSTGTIALEVKRNLNAPEMLQTSYTKTIDETRTLSSTILTFDARDIDTQAPHNTLEYYIENHQASQYFQIIDGALSLRSSLVGTPMDDFVFLVGLSDRGQPNILTAAQTATVTVNINRA